MQNFSLGETLNVSVSYLLTCLHQESGQTIVMVTHEREYAMGCDRIYHMEDGVIVDVEQL